MGTGMAEGFNGNPKRRLISEDFPPRPCPISIIELDYFLLYLFCGLANDAIPRPDLDKIKVKQDLAISTT
jgi:hypothetical protein